MVITTMITATNSGIGPINALKTKLVKYCKCGTEPQVGDKFYYISKYNKTGEPLEGYISEVRSDFIISTNRTNYYKSDIEIKTKLMKREEKLNKLGLL
jgi:hypothetical protein